MANGRRWLIKGGIGGYLPTPKLRAVIQNWKSISENGNFDLEVLADRADFGDTADAQKTSTSEKIDGEIQSAS